MAEVESEPAVPVKEYDKRLDRTKSGMKSKSIDALLIFGDGGTSTGNVRYLTNWYSLSIYDQSLLIVPINLSPILFIRLRPDRAKQISWIEDIRESGKPDYLQLVHDCLRVMRELDLHRGHIGVVGSLEETWRGIVEPELRKKLPEATFETCDDILQTQRLTKTATELMMMRRAAHLVDGSLRAFRSCLSLGMTDFEAIARGEYEARSNGAEYMLNFIGLSSKGEFVPPISLASPFGRKFRSKDTLIVEFNGSYKGYRCESLRMASFGRPLKEERAIFEAACACVEGVIKKARPGRKISNVIEEGLRILSESGYPPEKYVQRTHSSKIMIGHGIGLDMFEPPPLSTENDISLETGMTFALHPGIFGAYSGVKWGALLGDTICVTECGAQPLDKMEWLLNDFAVV